ncbi:putative uncharacterized protein [Bacillus sp. CAG:988]|mgnify:FL=1|nr:putative uncharacterized protein [Bacillus sp. CAG:988]
MNQDITSFQNEANIAAALHHKKMKELNPLYQTFIADLFQNITQEDLIECQQDDNQKKYDIVITVNGTKKYVSIKKGAKNSVHKEGISSFIHFLIDSQVTQTTIIEYLKYHYADGTTNGTGKERTSALVYKEQNQEKIDAINKEINRPDILKKAIDRFVLSGINDGKTIDAILLGTENDFIWLKKDDIIGVILAQHNVNSTAVHFGPLTVQPLDRCLNHNPKYEKSRFCVQIKWYNLFDSIIWQMNENIKKQNINEDEKV